MSNETWILRFLVYPTEIVKFIQYCERFNVIHNTTIKFIPPTYTDEDNNTPSQFVADVTLYSESDSLKFQNIFSLFFSVSRYCSRI